MKRRFFLSSLSALPLTSIVARPKKFERTKKGILIRADESRFNGELKTGDKSSQLCKVSSLDTDGDLLFIGPGEESFLNQGGPPLHTHLYQDEIFFVAQGEFIVQVGDEQFKANEGDTVFAPRQVPHTFAKFTTKPSKMITIFQPAGKMERFFIKLKELGQQRDRAAFAKLFEDHDMKVVGPPISPK